MNPSERVKIVLARVVEGSVEILQGDTYANAPDVIPTTSQQSNSEGVVIIGATTAIYLTNGSADLQTIIEYIIEGLEIALETTQIKVMKTPGDAALPVQLDALGETKYKSLIDKWKEFKPT